MDIERLKQAGFSDEEIKQAGVDVKVTPAETAQVKQLSDAGFSESEILNHFQNTRQQTPISVPQKPASKDIPLSSVPLTALENIPSSGYEFGKNILQAVIHPIQTAKGLVSIAEGGLGTSTPENKAQDTAAWEQFKNTISERYGGLKNIKNTIATDPVGSLSDVSAIFTGGGTLASRLPAVSKYGATVAKIGNVIEPLSVVGLATKPITKGSGKLLSGTTGFTTGAGADSVKQAFKAGKEGIPEFKQALKEPVEGLQQTARTSLQTIKDRMREDYSTRLAGIKTNTTTLDYKPVKEKLGKLETDYNIKRVVDKEGNTTFDFSRSTLDRSSVKDVENIIHTIEDWGKQPGDLTPRGMDILKRKLDDFYSDSKNSRGFVTALKNTVKDTILKQVPEYKTMLGNYEKSANQITEIEKTLSLGKKASADTAIRKLLSALKDNNEFRGTLIKALDDANGGQLATKLAAHNLQSLAPSSFMGKAIDISAIAGLMYAVSPKLAVGFAMASPRIVGEFAYQLGQAAKLAEKAKKIVPAGVRQAATQFGRYTQPQQSTEELIRRMGTL